MFYKNQLVLIYGSGDTWIVNVDIKVLILFGSKTEEVTGEWEILQEGLYPARWFMWLRYDLNSTALGLHRYRDMHCHD